jgi:hypothetical protein
VTGRRHKKGRYSLARLSSDTTASLPVYSQSPHTRSVPNLPVVDQIDPPPQYQYEADADEESDGAAGSSERDVVPPLSPSSFTTRRRRSNPSSSRANRPQPSRHRQRTSMSSMSPLSLSPTRIRSRSASPARSASPEDPYLDSLLARSVQALEVSNALLQSSMSTQTSFAALNANESPPLSAGPSRVMLPVVERSIPTAPKKHINWVDDMNDIEREINVLFDPSSSTELSRSLPSGAGPSPIHQRLRSHSRVRSCSSTDLRFDNAAGASAPSLVEPAGELHFGVNPRSRLIAPAPRALTQYIAADYSEYPDCPQGAEVVHLPSTLGLRAAGHAYNVPSPSVPSFASVVQSPATDGLPTASSSRAPWLASFRPGRAAPSAPPLPQPVQESRKQPETSFHAPSAASLLSSFLSRRPSTATTVVKAPKGSALRLPRRRASLETASPVTVQPRPISYHYQHEQTQLPHRAHTPSTPSSSTSVQRPSRSPTPTRYRATPPPPLNLSLSRAMTPPIEVSSPSSDSGSPGTPPPALSVQALRRIMAEMPPPRPKGLQPRTSAAPTVGTSHATASISRLFTRGTHMHAGSEDARIARRSALKQKASPSDATPSASGSSSMPATPVTPNAPPAGGPSFFGLALSLQIPRLASASSSGRSTPKRISFAALPEDTTGTVRGGRRARSRSRSRRRASRDSPTSDEAAEGWWAAWLLGGPSGGLAGVDPAAGAGRDARRTSWGRGSHGMEDFAV